MAGRENRQARRSGATRDHIVQSAVMLFALKGISQTSMDDICLAAGCSKGGLYHHFRAKHEVIAATIRRLGSSDALLPPFDSYDDERLPGVNGLGRVLIELWAAAAKDGRLRDELAAACASRTWTAEIGELLPQILQMGALVEQVTRETTSDPAEAARRLGIDRAA